MREIGKGDTILIKMPTKSNPSRLLEALVYAVWPAMNGKANGSKQEPLMAEKSTYTKTPKRLSVKLMQWKRRIDDNR